MSNKVAFVIHHLNPWGGHDRSTLEIVRRASRRFQVQVFSFSVENPGAQNWGQFEFCPVRPHFRKPALLLLTCFYISTYFLLKLIPSRKSRREMLIHATGACTFVSDVVQVQFVQAAWKKKMATLSKDIYQSPSTRSGGLIKKKIRQFYNQFLLSYNIWVERKIYTADRFYIAIAHCVSKELQECFGIPQSQIRVIHHGVDSVAFHPVKQNDPQSQAERAEILKSLGMSADEVGMIFVGEYERKGLAVSIRALAMLSPEVRSKVRLLAVGGGDTKGFAELAKACGVSERVILLGHQKDIQRYYRVAEIFLLPTLYEPFGLVIIEAMASGLAPIVSEIAGGSELIRDGTSGLLLKNPADPKEVSKAIEALVADPEKRKSLGRQARLAAEARSWDKVSEEYADLFSTLIAARQSEQVAHEASSARGVL